MNISFSYEIIGAGVPKIALITPSRTLVAMVAEVAREEGANICIVHTAADEEILAAREVIAQEQIKVIAARGQLAYLLRKEAGIPVLSIDVSPADILSALLPYQNTDKHLGLLAFPGYATECQPIAQILGIRFDRLEVESLEQLDSVLDEARRKGVTHVIGGLGLVGKAMEKGFEGTIMQASGKETIRRMFDMATQIIELDTHNSKQLQVIQAISNLSQNAILSMDQSGRITYANANANLLLTGASKSVVGCLLSQLLPHIDIARLLQPVDAADTCLTSNSEGRSIAVRHSPLVMYGMSEGAVLSLQYVDDIQRVEHRIRQKLYTTSHTVSFNFDDIIGRSIPMSTVKREARRFARTDACVLIVGETGTGKELFAQAIHNGSPRVGGAFVAINCAALPENLLESELFGYEDGAFTGARRGGKMGMFELAHGGTLFLDEIGEMPLSLQNRLLRVLQDKRVMRLGSNKLIPVDVRILAATNRDLKEMVREGTFRLDLFYRINTLMLRIPPLRERKQDIPLLVEAMLKKSVQPDQPVPAIDEDVLEYLQCQPWEGNVRELEHLIERAVILCESDTISLKDVMPGDALSLGHAERISFLEQKEKQVLYSDKQKNEEDVLRRVLEMNHYHRGNTAKQLGISRATLWRKMREMGM